MPDLVRRDLLTAVHGEGGRLFPSESKPFLGAWKWFSQGREEWRERGKLIKIIDSDRKRKDSHSD